MGPQGVAADGQDYARVGTVGDRDQHRGGRAGGGIMLDHVAGQQLGVATRREGVAQALGERHSAGSSAKKAPSLHRPGGSLPSAKASSASS